MPHLDSVDSDEMPWLSVDTLNGVFHYFFTILFIYCNTTKAKKGVEYKMTIYSDMKLDCLMCSTTVSFTFMVFSELA